jgi:hypothetical protein
MVRNAALSSSPGSFSPHAVIIISGNVPVYMAPLNRWGNPMRPSETDMSVLFSCLLPYAQHIVGPQ